MEVPERGQSIKRHEALKPLSRHHMSALHLALKLRRIGTDESDQTPEQLRKEVASFWIPDGQAHFREEQEILLTTFAKHADIQRPEIQDMLIEHVQIWALMDQITATENIDLNMMHELGVLLDGHVRKEERIIFPMIEQALPESILQEMAPYLA